MRLIAEYLPWLLSACSLLMAYLTGNKYRNAWLVGLGVQCLWVLWIYASRTWGFLPLCLMLFGMYARNHVRWKREATR